MPIPVSAILLAAGSSRRTGQLKQLLPLGDKPIIRHCLDCIIASGIKDIVAVVGQKGEIVKTINDLPVKIVFNEAPESEMAESVRIGLRVIDDSSTGVLICLSDHPLVLPETLRVLIDSHSGDPGKIIIPMYTGKRGHPSLFPIHAIKEIFEGLNLRDVINKTPGRIKNINVEDEGILLDMDTIEDYKKISKIAEKGFR